MPLHLLSERNFSSPSERHSEIKERNKKESARKQRMHNHWVLNNDYDNGAYGAKMITFLGLLSYNFKYYTYMN